MRGNASELKNTRNLQRLQGSSFDENGGELSHSTYFLTDKDNAGDQTEHHSPQKLFNGSKISPRSKTMIVNILQIQKSKNAGVPPKI